MLTRYHAVTVAWLGRPTSLYCVNGFGCSFAIQDSDIQISWKSTRESESTRGVGRGNRTGMTVKSKGKG